MLSNNILHKIGILAALIVNSLPLSLKDIDPTLSAASSQIFIFLESIWSLSLERACVVRMID